MLKRIVVGIGLLVTVLMIFNIKIGIGFFSTYYSKAIAVITYFLIIVKFIKSISPVRS